VDARTNSTGLSLPVTRGLVACHFLDGAAEAVRNRVDGQVDGVITNTPTWYDGYGAFVGSTSPGVASYLSTDAADVDLTDVTILTVVRSSSAFSAAATRPQLAGSYGAISSDLYSTSLNVTGTPSSAPAATVAALASRNNGGVPAAVSASITVTDMSAWTILAMTVLGAGGAGALNIYNLTNAATATATMSSARMPHPTRLFQIGATSSTLIAGAVDNAAFILHDAVLTQAELTRQAAGVRRRMLAYHGIVC